MSGLVLRVATLFAVAGALAGCGGGGGGGGEVAVSSVCIRAPGPPDNYSYGTVFYEGVDTGAPEQTELAAGEPAEVVVSFEIIPARKQLSFDCSTTLDGPRVEVSATGSARGAKRGKRIEPYAKCAVPALDAGDWELVFDGASTAFQVPHVGEPPCLRP